MRHRVYKIINLAEVIKDYARRHDMTIGEVKMACEAIIRACDEYIFKSIEDDLLNGRR